MSIKISPLASAGVALVSIFFLPRGSEHCTDNSTYPPAAEYSLGSVLCSHYSMATLNHSLSREQMSRPPSEYRVQPRRAGRRRCLASVLSLVTCQLPVASGGGRWFCYMEF
jgi:hypothetical protein